MKKKFLNCFLILVAGFVVFQNQAIAGTSVAAPKTAGVNVKVEAGDCNSEVDIIKRVSFRDKFKKSPEAQINSFFKKYNKYSSKNEVDKLKEMFADEYINNDGFNKHTIFKMMEMAADVYENVEYSTVIENINTDGNYAVVKARETAIGQTANKMEKIDDYGNIKSDIYYTDYLKKTDNKWKITATFVDSEEVSLTYGEAKNMKIDISAPKCVPADGEYEVTVRTQSPDDVFMVGSITNDPIVYPQVQNEEVFRSVKSDELARVLRANTDGNNEYATLSIAMTRARIEPPSVVLNMTGIAFVMKRVNVIPLNRNIKFDEVN